MNSFIMDARRHSAIKNKRKRITSRLKDRLRCPVCSKRIEINDHVVYECHRYIHYPTCYANFRIDIEDSPTDDDLETFFEIMT